jgi:pantetheine-phosphate adenylyltransferase
MIREVVAPRRNVECTSTAGYVVDLARERAARYLVRGVRSCTDVDGEIALADMNRALAPEIETVFIPAHPSLSEVSSSRLKELASRGEDVSLYCPPEIAARLQQRVAAATLAREEGAHA